MCEKAWDNLDQLSKDYRNKCKSFLNTFSSDKSTDWQLTTFIIVHYKYDT